MNENHDWYLYLVPFQEKDEFKFGKGKGLAELARVKQHNSRHPIDLKDAYVITGTERSISKLESVLKVDYSTEDFILPPNEMEEKYPSFLKDGYTEIRRKSCLQPMIEHIEFKRTRPAMQLSELTKGIKLPRRKKKQQPPTRKKRERVDPAVANAVTFKNWLIEKDRYFEKVNDHLGDILSWRIITESGEEWEKSEIFLFTQNRLEEFLCPRFKDEHESFVERDEFFRMILEIPFGGTTWSVSTNSVSYKYYNRGFIQLSISKGVFREDYDLHAPYYDSVFSEWNTLFSKISSREISSDELEFLEAIKETQSASWSHSSFSNERDEHDNFEKFAKRFYPEK